jgi:hypothetical protein
MVSDIGPTEILAFPDPRKLLPVLLWNFFRKRQSPKIQSLTFDRFITQSYIE